MVAAAILVAPGAAQAGTAAAVYCQSSRDANPGTYHQLLCENTSGDVAYQAVVRCSNGQTVLGPIRRQSTGGGWSRATCPTGTTRVSYSNNIWPD
jgi:hypothetical protein